MVNTTKNGVETVLQENDFVGIAKLARETIASLVDKKPLSVIRLNRENGNWVAVVEVLERAAIPDTQDLIGKYQMTFGKNKELLNYKRIEIRRKGQLEKEEEEEAESKK